MQEHPHDHGHDHDHHGDRHDHDDHAPSPAGGGHRHGGGHGHVHGRPVSGRGALRTLGIASVGLAVVSATELAISALSGSAAVLADGLHNLGDVFTTVALAGAFVLSNRAPTRRFPYGYHRGEDLAGVVVLLLIVASAIASGTTSIEHLLHRSTLSHPGVAFAAALVGFVGNETVARYKTVMGRRLRSLSLVADGQHSRIDGLASLGAAAGVAGAWAGVPELDPVAGLLLTVVIGVVAFDTARNVTARLLDEADASLLAAIEEVAAAAPGVVAVSEVRARWTGRRMRAELVLAVSPDETVSRAHALGEQVRHELFHRVEGLVEVVVHLDPAGDAEAHQSVRHHEAGGPDHQV
ncbi:MAG TPA: cation diffusion facilitator family transporter [Candidatus Dormibacteraeota bacterium]|nr:cation diffusion facilitator family transporter [Candidatus Dormibacteraeota bacterium]